MSGISKIGRDEYGIFPLKGKLLNVKDQSPEKILKNEEINNLKKILGLKQNYKYQSLTELFENDKYLNKALVENANIPYVDINESTGGS